MVTVLNGCQGLTFHCQQLLPGAQPGFDGCRACQACGLRTPWLWHSHTKGSRTPSGFVLAGSPARSGYPPRCQHCPDLPLGLFGMSLLLPRNLQVPNALQAELDPGPS